VFAVAVNGKIQENEVLNQQRIGKVELPDFESIWVQKNSLQK
jgi:hypothetical protein